ncbi:MAG: hypothetical protein QOE34_2164 [Verrucomicrobiota bacterium]|jgi:hypothetical protein
MKILRILAAVVLIGVALLRIASCNNYGKKLTFNGGDLYYTSHVTEAEAKKLGDYLVKGEFFNGTPKTVQLNKTGDTYEFRAVVKKDTEKSASTVETFTLVAKTLSDDVFNHSKVVVHLCDDHLKTLRVVPEK